MSGEDGAELFYADLHAPLPVGTKLYTRPAAQEGMVQIGWEVSERSGTPLLTYTRPSESDCAEYELSLRPVYVAPRPKGGERE